LHLTLCSQSSHHCVQSRRETQIVQLLIMLPDCVLRVNPRSIHVSLLDGLLHLQLLLFFLFLTLLGLPHQALGRVLQLKYLVQKLLLTPSPHLSSVSTATTQKKKKKKKTTINPTNHPTYSKLQTLTASPITVCRSPRRATVFMDAKHGRLISRQEKYEQCRKVQGRKQIETRKGTEKEGDGARKPRGRTKRCTRIVVARSPAFFQETLIEFPQDILLSSRYRIQTCIRHSVVIVGLQNLTFHMTFRARQTTEFRLAQDIPSSSEYKIRTCTRHSIIVRIRNLN